MLILTRKIGEKFFIGDNIDIITLDVTDTHVRFGIKAPEYSGKSSFIKTWPNSWLIPKQLLTLFLKLFLKLLLTLLITLSLPAPRHPVIGHSIRAISTTGSTGKRGNTSATTIPTATVK